MNSPTQLRHTTPNVTVQNLDASGNRQTLMNTSKIAMPKQPDFSENVRQSNLAPTNDQAYNTNYYYNTNIPIFYDKSLSERYGLNRQSTPAQRRNEASVLQGLNKQKQNASQTTPANDLEVPIHNTVLNAHFSTFDKKKKEILMNPPIKSKITMPKQPDFSENVRQLNIAPIQNQALMSSFTRPNRPVPKEDMRHRAHQFNLSPDKSRTPTMLLAEPNILASRSESNLSYYNPNIPTFSVRSHDLNGQSTHVQRRNETSVLHGLNEQKQIVPVTTKPCELFCEVPNRNIDLNANSSTFEKKKKEILMNPPIESKITMPKQPDFSENVRQLNIAPIQNQARMSSFTRPNPPVPKEDTRHTAHRFNLSPDKSRTPTMPLAEPNILDSRSESNLSYYNPNIPTFSVRSHDLNGQLTHVQRRNETSVLHGINKQKQIVQQTTMPCELLGEVPNRNIDLNANFSGFQKKQMEIKKMKKSACVIM